MRASLVLGFSTVILLTAAAILLNSIYTSRKVVRTLSNTILDQTCDLAELKLDEFFGVVARVNAGTAVRLENGLLAWQDWDAFRLFLQPMLQQVDQVSGVGAGDDRGNAYNLLRFGTNWRSQEIRPAEWGGRTLCNEWTPQGLLVREWWEESEFDPRQRPWFIGALAAAERPRSGSSGGHPGLTPYWTRPYKFFTSGQYGMTVATRIPWTNQLEAVVYFDVDISELDRFVAENRPSPNGYVLVLNDAMEVLGWPGSGEYARERVLAGEGSVDVATNDLPRLAAVLEVWKAQNEPAEMIDRVRAEGRTFWLAFRSLSRMGERFHVLVAVPEDDILGEARRERQRMVGVLAVGLVVSIGVAFWLAAVFSRPISSLVDRSEAIERLDLSARSKIVSKVSEVQALSTAQSRMSSALESFSRYVPREVIAELLRRGEAARIGAHPAELTVLFSDIRHFTSISEKLSPDQVAHYLSDYFEALHCVIERHQGTTDKFIGDALMAFWGAPRPDAEHALNAVRAALECHTAITALNQQWKGEGRPEFLTTFGLASGSVVVGNVGAQNRLNYTVLGNTVNVASRCVGLGRDLGCGILALESVAHATRGEVEWRRLGPVIVRGIREPKMVCEPLGLCGHVPTRLITFRERYEKALDAYLNREFTEALRILDDLVEMEPGELSVSYLVHRCRALKQTSPAEFQTELLSFH